MYALYHFSKIALIRYPKFVFLFVLLGVAQAVYAQPPNPTVEVVLSAPTAKVGDTVTAEVYIRDATNIGGADIGITVDDKCLRITNRQAGTFIPSDGAQGGFSPFSEMHDHDTRFAASITDRTKLGNGDGVFYAAQLQVICESGVAPINVTFAEFSAYKDPTAKEIELVAYTLSAKTVNIKNAQLVIGNGQAINADGAAGTSVTNNTTAGTSGSNNTAAGTSGSNNNAASTSVGAGTQVASIATPVAGTTSQTGTAAPAPSSPIVPIVVIVLTIIGVGILGGAFFILRRRPAEEEEE